MLSPPRLVPFLVSLSLSVVCVAPVLAADTIEAFDPGVSDLEAGWSGGSDGGVLSAVVGAGVTRRLSMSASLERGLAAAEHTAAGVGAFLGLHDHWAGIDLFGELGWDALEGAPSGWLAGLELDDPRHLVMPYLRTAVAGSAAGRVEQGLLELGVATAEPVGRLHPHLELAVAVDWQGYAGVDLALGPNLGLGESVELVPELRASWTQEQAGPSLAATVGMIVTRAPESWDERLARRRAEGSALATAR